MLTICRRPRIIATLVATAGCMIAAGAAWGQEGAITLPPLKTMDYNILYAVLASAFVALAYGIYLRWRVLKRPAGSKEMQEVATAIQEGARAYLAKQAKTMAIFIVLLTVGLYFMYRPVYADKPMLAVGIAIAGL